MAHDSTSETQEAINSQTPADRLAALAHDPTVDPVVAFNPEVNTHLLRERGLLGDDVTLAAVAANPNTPVATLLSLAGRFPGEFCSNPVLPLLLLENPDLPAGMDDATLRNLLRYPDVPQMLLEWIANYAKPPMAVLARMHVRFAGEAGPDWESDATAAIWKHPLNDYNDLVIEQIDLAIRSRRRGMLYLMHDDVVLECIDLGAIPSWLISALVAHSDKEVRHAIARCPNIPKDILVPLRRAGASGDLTGYAQPDLTIDPTVLTWLAEGGVYARKLAARHPCSPSACLERLARDEDLAVRQFVARNPSVSPSLLERLSCDPELDVRQQVAHNSNTPPEVLDRLAGDPGRNVRWTVARNPHTPAAALTRLAQDSDRVVRQGVARNPKLPTDLFNLLASDPHQAVRLTLARHSKLPRTALTQLSNDAEPEIRAAIARHPECPIDVRVSLQADLASNQARSGNPSDLQNVEYSGPASLSLEHQAEDSRPLVRAAVAAQPHTSLEVLKRLAEDDDAQVRAAVARNPYTAAELLAQLADDDSRAVRRTVAEHPNTPIEILERLAADASWTNVPVRLAVARHPHVTASILERLANSQSISVRRTVLQHPASSSSVRDIILDHALKQCLMLRNSLYHIFAYAHPATSTADLLAGAHSLDWLARYALSRNPSAPHEALLILAQDGNRFVRASAGVSLQARMRREAGR